MCIRQEQDPITLLTSDMKTTFFFPKESYRFCHESRNSQATHITFYLNFVKLLIQQGAEGEGKRKN